GGEGRALRSVTTDSRSVEPGALFVALGGERQDGHRFVADALRRGAAGAFVRRDAPVPGADPASLIDVEDPGRALMDLARVERSALGAVVIGVTGSTGKTTTKDFIAAVLSRRFRTVASAGSFNNEVGGPRRRRGGAPASGERTRRRPWRRLRCRRAGWRSWTGPRAFGSWTTRTTPIPPRWPRRFEPRSGWPIRGGASPSSDTWRSSAR